MFLPGQIVYFNEFFFKNGNTSKPKYFIVLKNINDELIIASLPTRTNLAASLVTTNHGCVNIDERCFNCYVFEQGRVISENGFFFPITTFLYGDEIEDYKVEILEDVYKIAGVDYEIVGQLNNQEYESLINCLVKSKSVKRKIIKYLTAA